MKFPEFARNPYADPRFLLEELRGGQSRAILFLQDSATGFAVNLLKQKNLPDHLLHEILNDAAIIFLKKIREQNFTLDTAKPLTYFIEFIKNVAANKTRTRQFSGQDSLENQDHLADSSVEEFYARKEHIELIDRLLSGAGEPCGKVIRLKYLDGFSDEEVVRQRLAPYSTVESLRVKRSDCLKKLRASSLTF